MTVWLYQHGDALRLALRRLAAAPVNTLLSLLAIGTALALPLGGFVVFSNVQQLARITSALPQISVFMRLDAERKAASDIESRLRSDPAIASIQFLAREATLNRMRDTKGLSAVIDVLPSNPFPDAFVVTPVDTDADQMEALAARLRSWKQVEHVQIDSDWVRRLNALLNFARTMLEILTLLLAGGLISITFNTIRLQVLTLKNEIAVSQLLGATDAFIRRPFFYFGALQGALGGGVAWLIVAVAAYVLREPLTELGSLYALTATISLPGLAITVFFIVAAAALGWLGAAFSLSQYLRQSAID